ncbi:MAG: hypothetical protein AB9869_25960 [Verrucomicrobiia bacterium]
MIARVSNFEREQLAARLRRLEALSLQDRDIRWLLNRLKVQATLSRGSRRGEVR